MDEVVAAAEPRHRTLRKGLLVFAVTGVLGALLSPILILFIGGSYGVESPYAKYSFLLWPVEAIDKFAKLFVETKEWGLLRILATAFIGYGLLGWGLWMLGRCAWRLAGRRTAR